MYKSHECVSGYFKKKTKEIPTHEQALHLLHLLKDNRVLLMRQKYASQSRYVHSIIAK